MTPISTLDEEASSQGSQECWDQTVETKQQAPVGDTEY